MNMSQLIHHKPLVDNVCIFCIINTAQGQRSPQLHATQPLMEAGLDSLGAVELRNALSSRLGVDLPATLTLDYPTIETLASHLAALHGASKDDPDGIGTDASFVLQHGSLDLQVCATFLFKQCSCNALNLQ